MKDMQAIAPAVEAVLRQAIEDNVLSCAGLRVIHGNKTIYHGNHGYADWDEQTLLTDKHLFRMASMAKPVTAACVMQLVEQDRLHLDDPVSRYVPAYAHMRVAELDETGELVGTHPAPHPITVRELLSHCSGLGSGQSFGRFFGELGYRPDDTLASKIEQWPRSFLEYDPGTRHSYSYRVAFDVLAYLVALVSDMPWADYTKEKLFLPLGMTDTGYAITDEQWSRLVQMVRVEDGSIRSVDMGQHIVANVPRSYHSGGGGLVSSVADYTRFARMLLGEGTLDGVQVLRPETVRLMHTRQLPIGLPGTQPGASWGLSFRVLLDDQSPYAPLPAGTFYWYGAYGSYFWCDPKNDLCVVYGTNVQSATATVVVERLMDAIYRN